MATEIQAVRYHDFSYGHRVYGHEGKCKYLHGHNGRMHFIIQGNLDVVGRVIDFSVIKKVLCAWLEENWDHKFLIWQNDSIWTKLRMVEPMGIVLVPFNPTAENMAKYMLEEIGPELLKPYAVELVKVIMEETRKCKATATKIIEDNI